MSCPKCNSEHIGTMGFYVTKLYKKRYRYRCFDCNKTFIVGKHIDSLSLKQQDEVIRLSRRKNPYTSKYDNRKERTYSIREIEKITGINAESITKVLKR